MKTLTQFKSLLASLMLGGAFVLAPVMASASSTTTPHSEVAVGTVITTDGFVRVAGATITAVSGNVISATTAFGSTVLNWILNVSADTKIFANGSANASTTALAVGDKIAFTGKNVGQSGTALVVDGKTVYDRTSMKDIVRISGTVASVSTSTNSLTITKKDGSTVTINTDASTNIKMNGVVVPLASIVVGNKVAAAGHISTNGTVLAATEVTVKNSATNHGQNDKDQDEKDNNKDGSKHENQGLHLGAFMNFGHFFSNDR